MKMKKWLDITIKLLFVLYYLQIIFFALSWILLSGGEMENEAILLILIATIVILTCLFVRIVHKGEANRNTGIEVLTFKVILLTSALVFSKSLFPIILILLMDCLTSIGFSRLLYNNPTLAFVISLIVYVCIVCYLLKEYKDKSGATDKTQLDE